jgi:AbrB family looped-hinge helix DNA binding protein
MTTTAVKITSKGQVTIPKEIRERLESDTIYFEVVDNMVVVRAVKDVAGSLREYAGNVKGRASMKKMKERAWEEAVHEKKIKKSS